MKARRVLLPFLMLALLGCSGQSEKEAQPQPPPKTEAQAPASLSADAYSFSASLVSAPPVLRPGETGKVQIALKNTSSAAWPAASLAATTKPLCAAYHVFSSTGELLTWDGNRTPITSDVAPGGEVALALSVQAPSIPGRYIIRPDLVEENVAWFSRQNKSLQLLSIDLHVQAAP